MAAAEAALEKAERDVARTRIRAPFAGRVRDKLADVGQFVSPGVSVAHIFAVDYVEVRLPIPDSELAFLDLRVDYRGDTERQGGPQVVLYADFAGDRHSWQGTIVRVEGEIDPVSRMVNAIAQVDDPYGRDGEKGSMPLAVGLFVEAEIIGREVENAIVVPRLALRNDNSVLVVDEENRLRFREVDIVRVGRENAVVARGLTAGERVCVSMLEAVTDGMKVRTINDREKPLSEDPEGQPPGEAGESGDSGDPDKQPPDTSEMRNES
ncbi:MAG: efflux RND transporter periplasmic adaptor subunit [Candidatus Latescibacterota bacterium]|nr:MAG: efflux RND transporter periplasmic adaptor subunit [Candidatus Latescibacterota bacterium]